MPRLNDAYNDKRVALILRALHEADASSNGEVGYQGTINRNGSRYILKYLYGRVTEQQAIDNTMWCVSFVKHHYEMHDDQVGGVGFVDLVDEKLAA